MKEKILVKARIAMALSKLGSANSLQVCVKVYDIVKTTTTIIMRKICGTIRKHLKPLIKTRFFKSLLVLKAYMEFLTFQVP